MATNGLADGENEVPSRTTGKVPGGTTIVIIDMASLAGTVVTDEGRPRQNVSHATQARTRNSRKTSRKAFKDGFIMGGYGPQDELG